MKLKSKTQQAQQGVLDSRALIAIWRELDDKDWSPDTLDAIAAHVRMAGYKIRAPRS
jgi:predicted DCC family thiol-disulfide oxidoreductase YuxK